MLLLIPSFIKENATETGAALCIYSCGYACHGTSAAATACQVYTGYMWQRQIGVSLENHHRAVDDAEATAEIFEKFIPMLLEKRDAHDLDAVNELGRIKYGLCP